MSLAAVRKHYKVPARRGMTVWGGDETYTITGTPRGSSSYINIRNGDGYRYTVHPFAVDYMVDGKCVTGESLKKQYDAKWDAFNEQMNAAFRAEREQADAQARQQKGGA